jgi:hypothetical protein
MHYKCSFTRARNIDGIFSKSTFFYLHWFVCWIDSFLQYLLSRYNLRRMSAKFYKVAIQFPLIRNTEVICLISRNWLQLASASIVNTLDWNCLQHFVDYLYQISRNRNMIENDVVSSLIL